MNTLREQWESYLADVMPRDAPPVQIQETRRAFYAGARAMQALQLHASTLSDDAGVHMLQSFSDELVAFGLSVGTPQEGQSCEVTSIMRAGLKPC